MGAQDDAAVVWHVEPFMGVRCPGVDTFYAGQQRPQPWAGSGPQPERAIHVDPRAGLVTESADLRERIDRPGVDVAGLSTDDRRSGRGSQSVVQRLRAHPSLLINSDRGEAVDAHTEEPECSIDGVV